MKRRTAFTWGAAILCVGLSMVLGHIISVKKTSAAEPHLRATVAALVRQNARQATAIANQGDYINYLFTQIPARNRVATVDALVQENTYRATDVAALYLALGSPAPTIPPTATFGPSPIPTQTPYQTPTTTLPPSISPTRIPTATVQAP